MKIGVLGTGLVGDAIASKLVALDHDVMMGSREARNSKATAWAKRTGARARAGTFADTAGFGEVLFNCTHGAHSLAALRAAGEGRLSGKIIVDLANVLPPDDRGPESLGEQIQKAFPGSKVVKTLNTMYLELMVNTGKVSGSHTVFMSGNDAGAKHTVRAILETFGWKDILDLGDISTARAVEDYLPLWFALSKVLSTSYFNIKVVR